MKHILITGASSGIGEALAMHYAAPGVTLSLSGRNADRLKNVEKQCRAKGSIVDALAIDVTNKKAMEAWILSRDEVASIDLVIANAGVGLDAQGLSAAEKTFAININGVINTVHPIIPKMQQRKNGHIALMSSLAGYRGLSSAPAYSASKCFVKAYGEALRGQLRPDDVKVTTICPGFVRSRLTESNRFPMPGLMEAEQAARVIVKGLDRNKSIIAFPWFMVFGVWFLSVLPGGLLQQFVRMLPHK